LRALTPRERVVRCLRFEEPDRVPIMDAPLSDFSARYREARGLPQSVDLEDHFGFDIRRVSCLFTPSLIQQRVLEREGDLETFVDGWGLVVRRWVGREGVPQVLRPAIRSEEELDDYFQDPDEPSRYQGLHESVAAIHARGLAVFLTMSEHWGGLYHIFGLKRLLALLHREPRLIRKTVKRLSKHYEGVAARVLDEEIDALWVFGDLAANEGPFISPARYADLLFRAHRSLFRPFRSRGLPVAFHSDGDIRPLLPMMVREGVSAIQPLDASAGMDVLELKDRYGDALAFMGNIPNKTVLLKGTPSQVASEVKRKLAAGQGGGYVLGSSHSISGDVPIENFEAMLEAGRRYGGYPAGPTPQ